MRLVPELPDPEAVIDRDGRVGSVNRLGSCRVDFVKLGIGGGDGGAD